ncbi:glycosyltransferase family 9 protein [Polynucleobacter sp. MWH-UH23A]|uniref:glycosyltransferase family 9 protein n=1 Tax=Polynucleobacter sp. MWH-UH23A TaxID=1855613 RepID=UPI00336509BB
MKKINSKFIKLKFLNDLFSLILIFLFGKSKLNRNGNSILVLDLHLLGDAVLDIPLIEAIKLNNNDKNIFFLTGSWNKPLFSTIDVDFPVLYIDCPWIRSGSVGTFLKQLHNLKKQFSDYSWNYCIDVRGDFRNILILFYLRVGGIVSFAWTGGVYMLSRVVHDDGILKHLAAHHVMILNALGINSTFEQYIPFIKLNSPSKRLKMFATLIHFGASKRLRSMPLDQAYSIFIKIRASHKRIIFVVDPSQQIEYTKAIESMLVKLEFEYLMWKGELASLIALIGRVTNVYAMDSGIAHLSAALGKQVTVFFGPSDKNLVGPLGHHVINIQGQDALTGVCASCDHEFCRSLEAMKCFRNIATKL